MESPTMSILSFEPRRAVRAIRALLRNPEDLPQVFTIIEALSGPAPARLEARFRGTPTGKRLLGAQPDIVAILEDREGLRRLPAGSLGRAYLAFVESENISAAGIRAASAEGGFRPVRSSEHEFVKARMRDTHDLWHALTGYRGDLVGEAVLLSFLFAQTWNPGVAFIVATALVKAHGQPDRARRSELRRLIVDGFRRGRAAAWLPDQEWEALLPLPLDEVRRRLGIEPPPPYATVRPADLRAGAAA
jgi:ubiquinone biosynthesis protein COQ4